MILKTSIAIAVTMACTLPSYSREPHTTVRQHGSILLTLPEVETHQVEGFIPNGSNPVNGVRARVQQINNVPIILPDPNRPFSRPSDQHDFAKTVKLKRDCKSHFGVQECSEDQTTEWRALGLRVQRRSDNEDVYRLGHGWVYHDDFKMIGYSLGSNTVAGINDEGALLIQGRIKFGAPQTRSQQ